MPAAPFLILAAWAVGKGWGCSSIRGSARPSGNGASVPRRAKWISSLMMDGSGMQLLTQIQIPLWLCIAVPAVMLVAALWLWKRPDA